MSRRMHSADLASGLAAAGMGIAAVWVGVAGPTRTLPVHWGLDGAADGWGTRGTVAFMLALLAVLTALLCIGMGVAARGAEEPARARALRAAQIVMLTAFTAVAALGSIASLSGVTSIAGSGPMAALSVALLLVGALLGRVGPNPFVGVRTPWALKSRLAWDRSNRLAGRLLALVGLIGLVAAPFAPQPLGLQLLGGALLLSAIAAVWESWRAWRGDPDRQPF